MREPIETVIIHNQPMISLIDSKTVAVDIYYSTALDVPKELLELTKRVENEDDYAEEYGVSIKIPVVVLLEATIRGAETHGEQSNLVPMSMKPSMELMRAELMRLIDQIDNLTYKE